MGGRERERDFEGIGERETSDFFYLFAVAQVADFMVKFMFQ